MNEDGLRTVGLTLCARCLAGEGGECHTPGCALHLNRAPDIPITAITTACCTGGLADQVIDAMIENDGGLDSIIERRVRAAIATVTGHQA